MGNLFGYYIKDKRIEKNISIRTLASLAGVSATYVSNIENGWRPAPSMDVVRRLAEAFDLSEKEKLLFYDIAAVGRSGMVAVDVAEYIKSSAAANDAIRSLMEIGIMDEDWQDFVARMKEKYKEPPD